MGAKAALSLQTFPLRDADTTSTVVSCALAWKQPKRVQWSEDMRFLMLIGAFCEDQSSLIVYVRPHSVRAFRTESRGGDGRLHLVEQTTAKSEPPHYSFELVFRDLNMSYLDGCFLGNRTVVLLPRATPGFLLTLSLDSHDAAAATATPGDSRSREFSDLAVAGPLRASTGALLVAERIRARAAVPAASALSAADASAAAAGPADGAPYDLVAWSGAAVLLVRADAARAGTTGWLAVEERSVVLRAVCPWFCARRRRECC
jgi:hypothetical protein